MVVVHMVLAVQYCSEAELRKFGFTIQVQSILTVLSVHRICGTLVFIK